MANLKIYHAGGTELEVSTGNRYKITQTYYATSYQTVWSINSTTDTSYDLITYIPATTTERTIVTDNSSFCGANSNFSSLSSLSYTTTTINGITYYSITLPANTHLLLLHLVSSSTSGTTYYYYYGGATDAKAYTGLPAYWEDINTGLNEMGETSQQGTQKTFSSESYKSINGLTWKIEQQSKATYKIYTANLTSDTDKKFIIRAKTTSNNIYPYPSSGASSNYAAYYFYCTINTNNGASLLAPINVREVTYGQEYEFELPTNANYVVLLNDIANLYEVEAIPAWIDGTLHQRTSGSWT